MRNFFTAFALSAGVLLAVTPIGSVRSAEPFRLSGVRVPIEGIRSWPLVPGDDVLTDAAAAILTFLDGTRVTLAPNSRAKLEPGDSRVKVRLLEGSLKFELGKQPAVDIYNRDLRQPGTAGTISIRPTRSASSPSTKIRTQALPPISRSQ